MINNFRTKFNKFLAFILISSIFVCVSYLIVYKVSFLPNGYDIEAVQKDNVSLKSFNLLGIEKDIRTLSFFGNDTWKIDEIEYQVKRQKESFWMLFSFVFLSLFLLVYKIRNGMKLWKAIYESNIISALILLLLLINTLNYIHDLIS